MDRWRESMPPGCLHRGEVVHRYTGVDGVVEGRRSPRQGGCVAAMRGGAGTCGHVAKRRGHGEGADAAELARPDVPGAFRRDATA